MVTYHKLLRDNNTTILEAVEKLKMSHHLCIIAVDLELGLILCTKLTHLIGEHSSHYKEEELTSPIRLEEM